MFHEMDFIFSSVQGSFFNHAGNESLIFLFTPDEEKTYSQYDCQGKNKIGDEGGCVVVI